MTRLLALLSCAALTVGYLAVDGVGQEKKDAAKKHEILMEDDKFKPEKITIQVGDTIVWVNKGKKTHAASADEKVPKDLQFDTDDIDAGKSSKPITFKKEGKIPYSCFHHAGMNGEITVKEKGK